MHRSQCPNEIEIKAGRLIWLTESQSNYEVYIGPNYILPISCQYRYELIWGWRKAKNLNLFELLLN